MNILTPKEARKKAQKIEESPTITSWRCLNRTLEILDNQEEDEEITAFVIDEQ